MGGGRGKGQGKGMRGFFFQEGGYLPVADLRAQLGVSERASLAHRAALGPTRVTVLTVAMTWRACVPG